MNNWDDLRFVLAVAQTGSLNRAAQSLGVTHATVLRRIAAFEERVGESVFLKSHRGYSLRPDRMTIIENAMRVQDVMNSIERQLSGQEEQLSGSVRITSTDSICQIMMPAIVARITAAYPDLQISVLSGNSHMDLERLKADITVRPSLKLEESLVGEIAGYLDCALYHSEAESQRWLGLCGPLARSRAAQWMDENVPSSQIDHVADSFLVLAELAATGQGRAILPTMIAEKDPRLKRMPNQPKDLSIPIWVAGQRELADTPRFRVVRDMLVEGIKASPVSLLKQNPVQSG